MFIAPAVAQELSHMDAPETVREWIAQPPPWLSIRRTTLHPDLMLLALDAGELETRLLAEELGASLMLIDEWDGRAIAVKRGISVAGTIGTLAAAAKLGLLDLPGAFSALRRRMRYANPTAVNNSPKGR